MKTTPNLVKPTVVQTVTKSGNSLVKVEAGHPFPALSSLGSFDEGLSIIAVLTGPGEPRAVDITKPSDFARHSHLASQPGCNYTVEIFWISTKMWNETQPD